MTTTTAIATVTAELLTAAGFKKNLLVQKLAPAFRECPEAAVVFTAPEELVSSQEVLEDFGYAVTLVENYLVVRVEDMQISYARQTVAKAEVALAEAQYRLTSIEFNVKVKAAVAKNNKK